MGFLDAVYYTGDLVKRNTPDISTAKRAGVAAYHCTSSAVTKIDQLVRDDETRALIGRFTVTLAKNAGKYVIYEGFKLVPGATVASKLVSDTMREVKQNNHKERVKSVEAKVDKLENDLMKSTSQPQNLIQSEKAKDMLNTFFNTEFVGNQMFRDLMVPKITRIENANE